MRGRVLDERLEALLLGVGGLPFALRNQEPFGVEDDHDAPRRHHRQRRRRVDEIIRLDFAAEQPIHAEGAQAFVDHLGELRGDRGLLAVVVAD
jgi:hypothetical protein